MTPRAVIPALAAAIALAACASERAPERPAASTVVDAPMVAPLPNDELMLAATAPSMTLTERQQGVLDEVRGLGAELFATRPPAPVFDEIELVYFVDGSSIELADRYLEAVQAQGQGASMRPRLAWLYHRLAMTSQARAQAEQAVRERPDDATAQFVYGFVHFDPNAHDPESIELVRNAFRRTLVLDSEFVGPGGVTADSLREELAALDAIAGGM